MVGETRLWCKSRRMIVSCGLAIRRLENSLCKPRSGSKWIDRIKQPRFRHYPLNLGMGFLCLHRRPIIGVGRFRILGGPRGGANSQQAHDVVMTSMRRNDVASTSFRRHVPTRFLINQCQIITILILKSDIIENSRIELREIVLPVPSNQIKVTFIIILPFNLVHL